jgi:hypothetical protein
VISRLPAISIQLSVVSFAALGVCAAQTDVSATVARIAAVERKLPWLWSPATEGLADIAYTYEVEETRRVTDRGGKVLPGEPGTLGGWRQLRMERIPLEFGAFLKCRESDGMSPCSDAWIQELERQTKNVAAMTAEDRARSDARREQRRERRRAFWDAFPTAMKFESVGPDQVRFSPKGGSGMLAAIRGSLWFDTSTGEVTRMEYELTRDLDEPFLRYPKGSRFHIVLAKSADDHYAPERIVERFLNVKTKHFEDRTTTFLNYRRFNTESKIDFGDKDKQPLPRCP